jgi:hypothetical protein
MGPPDSIGSKPNPSTVLVPDLPEEWICGNHNVERLRSTHAVAVWRGLGRLDARRMPIRSCLRHEVYDVCNLRMRAETRQTILPAPCSIQADAADPGPSQPRRLIIRGTRQRILIQFQL